MPDMYSQSIIYDLFPNFHILAQLYIFLCPSFDPPAFPDMIFLYGRLYVWKFPLQLCVRAFHTLHQRCVLAWTEMCRSFSHDISLLFSFSVTAL